MCSPKARSRAIRHEQRARLLSPEGQHGVGVDLLEAITRDEPKAARSSLSRLPETKKSCHVLV
jgi:hypothetical protein